MSAASENPRTRVINSVAPIRICDNGGWTDTWFAGHGKVFNIGVYPYVEVQIEVLPREAQADRIVLFAENYGERFVVHPERPGYDHHPLLESQITDLRAQLARLGVGAEHQPDIGMPIHYDPEGVEQQV